CSHFSSFFSTTPRPPRPTLFPYTTLFRSQHSPKEPNLSLSDIRAKDGRVYSFVVHYSPHAIPDEGTLVTKVSEIYGAASDRTQRSEEHTSELQSRSDLVCRLLLEKKKTCI